MRDAVEHWVPAACRSWKGRPSGTAFPLQPPERPPVDPRLVLGQPSAPILALILQHLHCLRPQRRPSPAYLFATQKIDQASRKARAPISPPSARKRRQGSGSQCLMSPVHFLRFALYRGACSHGKRPRNRLEPRGPLIAFGRATCRVRNSQLTAVPRAAYC